MADLRSAFASLFARQLQIESVFCERMVSAENTLATLDSRSGSLKALTTESADIVMKELKRFHEFPEAAEVKRQEMDTALFSFCERLE
jgi:hypothetical protein